MDNEETMDQYMERRIASIGKYWLDNEKMARATVTQLIDHLRLCLRNELAVIWDEPGNLEGDKALRWSAWRNQVSLVLLELKERGIYEGFIHDEGRYNFYGD